MRPLQKALVGEGNGGGPISPSPHLGRGLAGPTSQHQGLLKKGSTGGHGGWTPSPQAGERLQVLPIGTVTSRTRFCLGVVRRRSWDAIDGPPGEGRGCVFP